MEGPARLLNSLSPFEFWISHRSGTKKHDPVLSMDSCELLLHFDSFTSIAGLKNPGPFMIIYLFVNFSLLPKTGRMKNLLAHKYIRPFGMKWPKNVGITDYQLDLHLQNDLDETEDLRGRHSHNCRNGAGMPTNRLNDSIEIGYVLLLRFPKPWGSLCTARGK